MLYPWEMQIKIYRKWNFNSNLHLVENCIIKTMIKSSNKVLYDTAAEKYSNQALVWPERLLHSIMV